MSTLKWLPIALLGVGACDTMSPGEPGNLVPQTVAESRSLPANDLNGSRFHVETFGNPSKPVIIFLHGGPGGDYRGLLRLGGRYGGYSLTDEYFLVFWDQRGSGLSQRHSKEVLTMDTYTGDLNALANRYSPGRPVYLIGHSWGGMYATQYINAHPERVGGAVLIEPGPLDGATMERWKDDIYGIDLTAEWLNDYAWSSQFLTPDDHARMDYERMLGLRHSQPRNHESVTDPEPVWRQGAAAARYLMEGGQNDKGVSVYDFTTNLNRYTTPVLFIAGALSEVLGESLQRQQLAQYPSASLQVVANAGHDVPWTNAGAVITQVRTYLNARKGAAQ